MTRGGLPLVAVMWLGLLGHPAAAAQEALAPARPVTLSLEAGAAQRFTVDVSAGDVVEGTLAGRGSLVRLTVTNAEGTVLVSRERRGGARTPIVWTTLADAAGPLTVTVTSLERGGAAREVVLTLDRVGPADASARARVSAAQAIERAEALERTADSGPEAALAQYEAALAAWREAGDAVREAWTLFEKGRLLFEAGRPKEAVQAVSDAVERCRERQDEACEAEGLRRLGSLHAYTGQLQPGAEALQAALAIRERLGDVAGQAEALSEMGALDATRSQNESATSLLTRAVALARSAGDRRIEADATNIHAVLLASRGDNDRARELYEAALALRRAIGDEPGIGQTTSNLGVLHRGLGDPRRAIEYYEEALAIRRRIGALQPLANTLHNLGVVHADLGDHERALALFDEALGLWRKTGGRRGEAFTLQAIGQSYARLGQGLRALEHFDLCVPAWKAVGDKRGEAQTLMAAASVRMGRREHQRALDLYAAALALATEGGYKREIGLALTGRSSVRRALGDLEGALADGRAAHETLVAVGERREAGRALTEIGDVLLALDRTAEARAAFDEALAIFESVEDRPEQAHTLSRLARADERLGDADAARRHALQALDVIESARASLTAEGLSISLFASKRALYDNAIALLMRLAAANPSGGDAAAAFAVSERMRARSLLDLLASGEMEPRDNQRGTLARDVRRLQELINAKAARLTRLLAGPNTRGHAQAAAARKELDDLLARLDLAQAELRREDPSAADVAQAVPLTLADVQARLDDTTVLLAYALGPDRSVAWAVSSTDHATFMVPGRAEIERLAARVHDAVAAHVEVRADETPEAQRARLTRAAAEFEAGARALADVLLAPAAAHLNGRTRVLIVGDGVLQSLPFAAFPLARRDAARIGLSHELVMLPSASVAAALESRRARRPAVPASIGVFADPVFSSDDTRAVSNGTASHPQAQRLPRLRFSRVEADAITRMARGRTTVWSDFEASRTKVLDGDLDRFGILHFAAHAVVDQERPQLSGIVLSQVDRQGRAANGVVRLHEIYDLSLNARLVVLSACRTALGRPVEGEGLIGLSRGFLHAGADAVVATLWAVDDRATAAFMGHFYDALLTRGESPATALRDARQAMHADPRWSALDWAGFVVIGTSN